jgi:hypothetical protein
VRIPIPRNSASLAALAVLAAVAAPGAGGSIWVASGTEQPALRIDAHGDAEVTWRASGARLTLLVPPSGRVLPGAALQKPDVSTAAPTSAAPLAVAVRRTPDGWLWALQEWSPVPGAPPELHLARWKGAPTRLTLSVAGDRLTGRATFQGRGVSGFTKTPAGRGLRIYAYVDCAGCPGGGAAWTRLTAVAPKADGRFSLFLRPAWRGQRYRVTVAGPNYGAVRAPDAVAFVDR